VPLFTFGGLGLDLGLRNLILLFTSLVGLVGTVAYKQWIQASEEGVRMRSASERVARPCNN